MKKIALAFLLLVTLISSKISVKKYQKEKSNKEENNIVNLNPNIFIERLPAELSESSGLMFYDNLFWSFNDSGGNNIIYGFNREGIIMKEVEITNADNVDWEEIAQDKNFIYVGDFGNNTGRRKDLKIYKIKKEDITAGSKVELSAETIGFSYQNQKAFNFNPLKTNFDCEAMVEFEKKLFIFSKSWSNQNTVVYEIPKDKGEYRLNPIDSFNVNGLITGAGISPDKTKIALVGYRNFIPIVRLFTKISNNHIFNGDAIFFEMESIVGAQTEGICFLGNDTLLISCERTGEFEQQVFFIDLKKVF